jgi:hypothetical protein
VDFSCLKLSEVVLIDVELLDFSLSRENDLVKEGHETIVVDEVHSDTKGFQVGVLRLNDSILNGFKTFLSDSVVTNVQPLNCTVDFQKLTNSSGSVDIKHVFEKVELFD